MILFYWLVFLMPLERHPFWTQSIGGLTVIKYIGLACLLYAINYLTIRKRVPGYFRTPQAKWFIVFFLLSIASYVAKGPRFSTESNPFISYSSFVLLFFATITLVDSLTRLRLTLLAAVGSVPLAATYLLREWQKDPSSRPGWVLDPNDYGGAVALCLPIALSLLLERRPKLERFYCLGCVLVMVAGVAVAASRGGFLGLVVGLLVVAWQSRNRVRKLVPLIGLVVGLGLVTVASPLGQRLFSPTRADLASTQIREQLWSAALQMIKGHPIVGIGLGMFKPTVAALTNGQLDYIAHNTYLEIAAEMGLPTLLIFLMIIFGSVQTLERVRRRAIRGGPALLRQAVPGLQAGIVGCSVSFSFCSMENFKLFWLVLFLSMCLPGLAFEFQRRPVRPVRKSLEGTARDDKSDETLAPAEWDAWSAGWEISR
jgi:O-antigen ligase